jgi:hypothetical protein
MSTLPDLTPDEAQAVVEDYQNGASADQKIEVAPPPEPDLSAVDGDDDEKKKRAADELVELAIRQGSEFFHTEDSDEELSAYADVMVDDGRRTLPLNSAAFSKWLRYEHYKITKSALRPDVLKMAVSTLSARAAFEGECREVFVRVGTDPDTGYIYIDLADDEWRVVEVRPDGWDVVSDASVRFRRSAAMHALPEPERGGNFGALRGYLNLKEDGDFHLTCGWLVGCFRLGYPFTILVLQGEAGTAKSTATRVLRRLVDPNKADLRDPPHKIDDLLITTIHNHVIVVENASSISPALSDALCRLATGAGAAKRGLYTNHDEIVIDARRPVIMNGIEFSMRDDLASRGVYIELEPIDATSNIAEDVFWSDFERDRPGIFGAICDALSTGLQNIKSVDPERLPRMGDYMKWGIACESDFTVNDGDFEAAYWRNREGAVESVIEGDPVSTALRELAYQLQDDRAANFEGTSTALLKKLESITDEKTRTSKGWPRTARALSGRVMRAAPSLRQGGVDVQKLPRQGRSRPFRILPVKRPTEPDPMDD